MLQVYAKPGEDYITKYALEKAGIKIPSKKRERSKALDPISCPQCETLNPPSKKFCGQCGHSLTEDAKMQVDTVSQQLHELFAENLKAHHFLLNL
ncbi:MAG: zinc ribbon domain-containing protein [Methanoregula sp.]